MWCVYVCACSCVLLAILLSDVSFRLCPYRAVCVTHSLSLHIQFHVNLLHHFHVLCFCLRIRRLHCTIWPFVFPNKSRTRRVSLKYLCCVPRWIHFTHTVYMWYPSMCHTEYSDDEGEASAASEDEGGEADQDLPGDKWSVALRDKFMKVRLQRGEFKIIP